MKLRPLHAQLLAFVIAFFAVGATHWPPDYNTVGVPNSLYGIGLVAILLLAAALRLLPLGLLQATATLGVAAPLAVFARVLVETSSDPTSHNLWPFELIIAAAVSFPVAFAGALLGGLIAPWARAELEKRRQRDT